MHPEVAEKTTRPGGRALPNAPGLFIARAVGLPRMFWAKRNREEHRYYLLPGMGRSNRRKHRQLLYWSVVVGLLVSALFAYLLYCLSGNV